MTGGYAYMNNPQGALDNLELVVKQQTILESVPLVAYYQPYLSSQGRAVYIGSLRSRSAEMVRQAIVPGANGKYQRIQYAAANAYASVRGAFEVANIPENVSNLALDTFGLRSRLLLTSGGTTGSADPVDALLPGQQYQFPAAGTAIVSQFSLDVRGTDAAGGKIADEAIAEVQLVIEANVEDGALPVPPRITFPDFSATLTVRLSQPTHM